MRTLLVCVLSASLSFAAPCQPPCIEASFGGDLQLSDDGVAQNLALGFTFPFAGRSFTTISVSANGFVWLGSGSDSGCCNGSLSEFLARGPRIAVLWSDLNPSDSGSVHFNALPGRAVVTWNGVPEYGEGLPLTAQVQLLADGSMTLSWQAPAAVASHTALVGFTPGGGATGARQVDFANGLPFDSGTSPTVYEVFPQNAFELGGGVIQAVPNGQGGFTVTRRTDCRLAVFSTFGTGCPPTLPVILFASTSTRPAIGTTFDMIVGEAPQGTVGGAMAYGTETSVGLGAIGMTACTLYSSAAVAVPFTVQGRYSVVGLPIPADQGLLGATLVAQAALLSPGANPAGVVVSNGGRIEVGQ